MVEERRGCDRGWVRTVTRGDHSGFVVAWACLQSGEGWVRLNEVPPRGGAPATAGMYRWRSVLSAVACLAIGVALVVAGLRAAAWLVAIPGAASVDAVPAAVGLGVLGAGWVTGTVAALGWLPAAVAPDRISRTARLTMVMGLACIALSVASALTGVGGTEFARTMLDGAAYAGGMTNALAVLGWDARRRSAAVLRGACPSPPRPLDSGGP